jgi:serine protease AprX
MRYAIVGATIEQVQAVGATDIKEARSTGVIFTTLTEEQVSRLKSQGCTVTEVGTVKATVISPRPVAGVPTYTPQVLSWAAGLEDLRNSIKPPLYGQGINIALIGTGCRETHEKINGHVIYSKNYTSDPMEDRFDHDTGVCSIILAVAPSCSILNLKVLDDKGSGTEEEVVLAIDDCIAMYDEKAEYAPSVINLSLGSPDDGNPNNILRMACRAAIERNIWVIAAAGNGGAAPETIMNPACEAYVLAVGSVKYEPFIISEFSSRGPTIEGLVKPDGVFFGEDIEMASSSSDTATVAKSGTSFTAPFASGIIALYHESITRFGGEARYGGQVEYPSGVPAGIYTGVARIVSPQEMLDKYLPYICVKPQGVTAGKDNDYGYGLPYGPLISQGIGLKPAVDISTMLTSVVAIAMLGMMMTNMAKAMKG